MLLAGMGVMQTLPLAAVLMVDKGFFVMLQEIGFMFLSGGPLYYIFHIETKCYYFSQTLLAGGAKYRPTGKFLYSSLLYSSVPPLPSHLLSTPLLLYSSTPPLLYFSHLPSPLLSTPLLYSSTPQAGGS